jgi:hypothetical protein
MDIGARFRSKHQVLRTQQRSVNSLLSSILLSSILVKNEKSKKMSLEKTNMQAKDLVVLDSSKSNAMILKLRGSQLPVKDSILQGLSILGDSCDPGHFHSPQTPTCSLATSSSIKAASLLHPTSYNSNVDYFCTGGKADPYFTFQRAFGNSYVVVSEYYEGSRNSAVLLESEVVSRNLNPTWKTCLVDLNRYQLSRTSTSKERTMIKTILSLSSCILL